MPTHLNRNQWTTLWTYIRTSCDHRLLRYLEVCAAIYGGESIHQVAELIESFLKNQMDPSTTTSVLYDDGCHLKRAVMKKEAT